MFIQIIQGRCTRPDELRTHLDRWQVEQAPQAAGWLGGTYGFDGDDFLGVVRFESRAAAAANNDRPGQTEWAEQATSLMDGPVEYHDCEDVTVMMDGGSDGAGFVQVIRGRVADAAAAERLKRLMTDTDVLHRTRPDIIGATLAIEADGTFTETVAFTDEASARQGEQVSTSHLPDDVRETLEEAMVGARFWDLHHPWFQSA